MGLRLKNFNTMGFHCKTQFLGGGILQKTNCLKRGAWTLKGVCRFKGGSARKRGMGFLGGGGGGGDTPMHTMAF